MYERGEAFALRLTGVMRRGACVLQPCMTRPRVSENMVRSSPEYVYTASIFGHQSRGDYREREGTNPTVIFWVQIWGALKGIPWSVFGDREAEPPLPRSPSAPPHASDSEEQKCQGCLAPVQSIQEGAQQETDRQHKPAHPPHMHTRAKTHRRIHVHTRDPHKRTPQPHSVLRNGVLYVSNESWKACMHSSVCTASSLLATRKQQTDLFKAHYRW